MSKVDRKTLEIIGKLDHCGLDIFKTLKQQTSGTISGFFLQIFGFGVIYPSLNRLQRMGFVEAYWGNDRPVERAGARRKYYQLTEAGKKYLGS